MQIIAKAYLRRNLRQRLLALDKKFRRLMHPIPAEILPEGHANAGTEPSAEIVGAVG